MLNTLLYTFKLSFFDRLLKKAAKEKKKRFLLCWNRGLGDIPLGLYALIHRIREFIPDAKIVFITRADLFLGFGLLSQVEVLVDPSWKRGESFDLKSSLARLQKSKEVFDVIIEHPDPTRWVKWQLGRLTPKLNWLEKYDLLCERFGLDHKKKYIGIHIQTETKYKYEKNWPIVYWKECLHQLDCELKLTPILFGVSKETAFFKKGVIDLRGETTLLEMLSLIKNHCCYLLTPDSGVLSMTYYLNSPFKINVVSLWADPKQGVLKQQVKSPNPLLQHVPLIAKHEDLCNVSVKQVIKTLSEF
ncbi:MAG: glycosyltransferase family 9 protein [Candidatus Rhabdochlamydia sp.]